MKPKLIVLIGRRWFDKKYGNTYHDVEIIIHNNEGQVIHHRTNYTYGYGDAYISTAAEYLVENNILHIPRHINGGLQPLWQYCKNNDIKYITSVIDVKYKKELNMKIYT